MEHKTLVDAVVTAEWEMFSNVQNVGGKASCQMDPKTFRIMRSSQMDNWDDELLGSYLEDLLNARLEGRNLVTEKYARMMESTFPEEYAQLADSLPPLDPEAMAQVDDIVAAMCPGRKTSTAASPRWPTGAAPCAAVTTVRLGLHGDLPARGTAHLFPQDHRPLSSGHHGTSAQGRKRSRTEPAPSGAAVRL